LEFYSGSIDGVVWKPLRKHYDERGWLCELFRHDEFPADVHPAMAYVSATQPGSARGPHEHISQTDFFCFLGPGNFKVYLWDSRPQSRTFGARQTEAVGADKPMILIVPPGVVHAYRNISKEPGVVFNCPNRLYAGPGRKEPVDEIRHERDAETKFMLD